MRKRIFAVLICAIGLLVSVFATNNAWALDDSSSVYQKVWYAGVRTCYRTTVSGGGLMSSVALGDWDGTAANLFREVTKDKNGNETTIVHKDGIVPIVAESDHKMACVVLLTERTAYKLSKNVISDTSEKAQTLEDIKYTKSGDESSDDACFSFKYIKSVKSSLDPNYKDNVYFIPNLCVKKNDSGKLTVSKQDLSGQYDKRIEGDTPNEIIQYILPSQGSNVLKVRLRKGNLDKDMYFTTEDLKFTLSNYRTAGELLSAIGNEIAKTLGTTLNTNNPFLRDHQLVFEVNDSSNELETVVYDSYYYAACANYTPYEDGSGIECTSNNNYSGRFQDSSSNEAVYRKPSMRNSSDDSTVIEAFSKGAYNYEKIKFTDDERYQLYYYYLVNTYKATDIECYNEEQYNTGKDKQARLWWKENSTYSKYCYFNVKYPDKKVNGVYDDTLIFGKELSLDVMIAQMNNLTNTDPPEELDLSDKPTGTTGDENECYKGSGALGWILCPVIKGLTFFGNWMWNYVENNLLQLPTSQIFGNSGVKEAWSAILNVANVIFVILFMIVIFSQLTGVGIDNYGIKKILPRLIMVAILVNLSWIVCQLALDVSNILGVGFNSMLSSFASNIETSTEAASGTLAGITTVILGGGGFALFAILNPIGAIGAAFAVLGFIITTVVSILVMYLILLIREAGIIILIVLAPAAIVGYALPNTEKLSKKWFDLFKALLVVYPLCGLVMGGGKLAGVVLASIGGSNDDPAMKLAAMIVQVLPFFLIPMLLKNSLALMGNIGAKLSQAGKNFSKRSSGALQRGIQNSKGYKNWEKLQQEKAELRKANMRRGVNDWRTVRGLGDAKDRAEYKDLAAKVRSNTATDEEKKRFSELKKKSRYQPSELTQRRLSEDNALRREYASNRDKAMYGADDIVATGRIQSDKYANRKEAEDTSEWTDHFYRDSKGNTWLSDGKGGYSTVDKDGVTHTRTAKQMDAMRKNGDVKMVSRSEAMANRDMVARMKQTGQLAGYANTSSARAAGQGAILSSAESSQAELLQDAQSGQADVIRAQHDDNVTRRNEIAGKARASAAFRAQGIDPVVSVEAAKQAAEARLTGVASQNIAADDYANKVRTGAYDEVNIRKEAVQAGAIRNINQKTDQIASDRVGEVLTNIDAATKRAQDKHNIAEANNDPSLISVTRTDVARKRAEDAYNKAEAVNDPNLVSVTKMEVARQNAENAYNLAEAKNKEELVPKITREYAQTLEQKRFDTAQEKMYGEQMSGNTRSQSLSDLAGALGIADGSPEGLAHPNDVNYVMAAIKDIADKGGYEDLNTFIANNGRAIRQNPNINKAVSEYMATMSAEPAAKAYGKYTAKMRDMGYSESEISSYDMWLNAPDFGADADPNGAFSFQGFLRAGGDTALVNASKDTAKFYASKPEIVEHITPQMSINGALHAKDNETLLAHNDLIKKVLNKRPNREEAVKDVVSSTSSSQWSHMEDSTFGVIMDPYKDASGHVDMSKVPADVLKAFGQAKKDLRRAGGTVGANMRPEVKRFFDSIPDSYVK